MAYFWKARVFGGAPASGGGSPPAVPVLALVDNGDGTGAVATIAGSTAGSTNTIYAAPWSGALAGSAFTLVGTRVGDGTAALALSVGMHWVYVLSTLGGLNATSLIVGIRVTSGLSAVYEQAIEEVRNRIQTLVLPGISSDQVVIRKFPWDNNTIFPGVTVAWEDEREFETEGSNERDDVGYPIIITAVRGSTRGWGEQIDRITDWRQLIRREFHNKRLTTVTATNVTHIVCTVTPREVSVPSQFGNSYDASRVEVRAWFREPRT